MARVRLYQNSGTQMFADDPARLEDLELGIVMLYADTASRRVCSYLRGRLGQPIQATVECFFDDAIDLTAIESHVEANVPNPFRLEHAPEDDPTNRRWALQGLRASPLPVPADLREALRVLLDPDYPVPRTPSEGLFSQFTHAGAHALEDERRVDLAVEDLRDASRLFRTLVEEFDDIDFTIAVSKSGRVDCLSNTDVVIHIDDSVRERDSPVVSVDDTERRLADLRAVLHQRRLSRSIHRHVDSVAGTYADEVESIPDEHEDLAESVLRKELRSALGGVAGLTVVPARSRWTHPLATGVIGLALGFAGGILGADRISAATSSLATQLQADVSWVIGVARSFAHSSEGIYGLIAVCSAVALAGTVLLDRRSSDIEHDLSGTSAREDVFAKGLRLAVLVSVCALLGSIALLTYGG